MNTSMLSNCRLERIEAMEQFFLRIPVSALELPCPLCNFVHVLKFTLRKVFVSHLFNTTCFGLSGHHQVYKIVDENCYCVVTLLYFAFYE
jgi:hypothetical protein